MMMFIFSVLDSKYSFWKNWFKNLNLFVLSGICYIDLLEYAEFDDDIQFFCLGPKILFPGW